MPVGWIQHKALICRIQKKLLLFKTCMVKDFAASSQADRSLEGFFVSVPTPDRIVYSVDVENALDVKGNDTLDYGQVSPRVCESF